MSSTTCISIDNLGKLFRRQKQRTMKEMLPAVLRGGKRGIIDSFWALKDISLEIQEGETFGIIGENGSGKSTLLKLIAGVTTPTTGTVKVEGRITPLIELGAGFHPEMTGRENIFLNAAILGFTTKQTQPLLEKIIDFSEIRDFIDVPVKRYSSGMFLRLAFSVAVHIPFDILLVDEILGVGDLKFQQKCFALMQDFKRAGKTIIYVGHNLEQVERFCDRAAYLHFGKLMQIGKASSVVRAYQQAD